MKIFISFCGEGGTDNTFFKNITERVIVDYLFTQRIDAEISWTYMRKIGSSTESYLDIAKKSKQRHLLIYHRDADTDDLEVCLMNHFNDGDNIISENPADYCSRIVKAIPIQETEAWMLSDKELLKNLIDTELSNQDLQLTYQIGHIENIANPKSKIEQAIIIHKSSLPSRRRKIVPKLNELYEPFSQEVPFDSIRRVPSCDKFIMEIQDAIEQIVEELQ